MVEISSFSVLHGLVQSHLRLSIPIHTVLGYHDDWPPISLRYVLKQQPETTGYARQPRRLRRESVRLPLQIDFRLDGADVLRPAISERGNGEFDSGGFGFGRGSAMPWWIRVWDISDVPVGHVRRVKRMLRQSEANERLLAAKLEHAARSQVKYICKD